jgi:hypothetical protein
MGAAGDNHQVRLHLHRLLAFLVVAAVLADPCLNVCSGWAASAAERMACCADKSQGDADACCASEESSQKAESVGTQLLAALPALDPIEPYIIAPVSTAFASTHDRDSRVPLTSDSERHVLLSVFLI